MTYSKEDFAREFDLPEDEVRETLRACGLSLKKRAYDESERARFQEARELFANGSASSYDEIAAYFEEAGEGTAERESPSDSIIEVIRQEAIAQGFQLGIEQAEIIREVLPKATMMRLRQMIESGEFRRELQALWKEAFSDVGKRRQVTVEELEAHWTAYRLSESQTLQSLPPSSTESFDNE